MRAGKIPDILVELFVKIGLIFTENQVIFQNPRCFVDSCHGYA